MCVCIYVTHIDIQTRMLFDPQVRLSSFEVSCAYWRFSFLSYEFKSTGILDYHISNTLMREHVDNLIDSERKK